MAKTIKVSEESFYKLEKLAADWYVVKGEKPMPIEKVIKNLIDSEYQTYNPPTYQTSGFERL